MKKEKGIIRSIGRDFLESYDRRFKEMTNKELLYLNNKI